jgi:transcription elongation regulator 1
MLLQATSWQVPPEVLEYRKKNIVEDLGGRPPTEVLAAPGTPAEKSMVSFSLNIPAAATGGREAVNHKVLVANTALDSIKRKLQDSGAPATSSPAPPNLGPSAGNTGIMADSAFVKSDGSRVKGGSVDAMSTDSSSESDDEDPEPSKEERLVQFKVVEHCAVLMITILLR